jgi:hypothetical protein
MWPSNAAFGAHQPPAPPAERRRSGFLARRAFRRAGLAGAGAAAQVFFRPGPGLEGVRNKNRAMVLRLKSLELTAEVGEWAKGAR